MPASELGTLECTLITPRAGGLKSEPASELIKLECILITPRADGLKSDLRLLL